MPKMLRAAAISLLLLSSSFASSPRERGLSFEERVRAQKAIERVYYSHQLEATQAFEQAVPRAVLEAKVDRYLRQSAALESVWKTPITAEMLRREMERISAATRLPERLREISAALDHDPVLIQECLARPALVDRLIRGFVAGDRLLQTEPRQQAERLRADLERGPWRENGERRVLPSEIELRRAQPDGQGARVGREGVQEEGTGILRRDVSPEDFQSWRRMLPDRVGEVSPVEETRSAFIIRLLRESSDEVLRFTEYALPKQSFEAWWQRHENRFDPAGVPTVASGNSWKEAGAVAPIIATSSGDPQLDAGSCVPSDAWDNGVLDDGPAPRSGHTAVWTGSLMLVWGGVSSGVGTGDRYDPAIDSWSLISSVGAPENRRAHTAVWTGTQMIVWGGISASTNNVINTGGKYDLLTDTWTSMSLPPTLGGRHKHTMVWTGTQAIVFGGRISSNPSIPTTSSQGRSYDPATDSWTAIQTPGWTGKAGHTAVWSGSKMLVWGGNEGSAATQNGGAYDPVANGWSTMTTSGAPPAAQDHTAIWTGSRMIVWGGWSDDNGTLRSSGGIYDPAANSWVATTGVGAPTPRAFPSSVWTGTEMIIWGGGSNSGGRLDPNVNAWTPTSLASAPTGSGRTAIWTGSLMVVWGGNAGSTRIKTGGRYDPSSDSWTPTSLGPSPDSRSVHSAVWTGNAMIVWGGVHLGSRSNSGDRYDPLLDSWSTTSLASAPEARGNHTAVWTGSRMVIWGGMNVSGASYLSTGGQYDPIADSWSATSITGAPSARIGHSAVWTGSAMVLWGGRGQNGLVVATGGRYDPAGDTWSATASAGAPAARHHHTAIWTGSRLVVWGGVSDSFLPFNAGGRYNPLNDQWDTTTTLNAPAARFDHSAVWTGTRMLVWGGYNNSATMASGGQYNPQNDSWTPTSTAGAPTPRSLHSAVWTGSAMVIWGGDSTNTGGLYDPAADSWSSTSLVDAPSPRSGHTAVWTSSHMIVWGGDSGGGRYGLQPGGSDLDGDGSPCELDCDDTRAAVHPGAAEICDGLDNDCDGSRDEGFQDLDTDGFAACIDCDDHDASIHPQATETCNGVDDDCDTVVDDRDLDLDGYSACTNDCNDGNPLIHPGGTELCNSVDDDCDSVVDEGFDADGDGVSSCAGDCNNSNPAIYPGAPELCNHLDDNCNTFVDEGFTDQDTDGFAVCAGDCNDTNPAIRPGATEVCNGVDDNCNGTIDSDTPDGDSDGFVLCDDCNDANPAIHPGAEELCNGVNDDCDGEVDERDADADGFPGCSNDCNDADPDINPGATEACNGVDDNCNNVVDDLFVDGDLDGSQVCQDCNDADSSIHPGAEELCNGVDENCNQVVDDRDADGDAFTSCGGPDCDDSDPSVHPGAAEACNASDDDCDLLVDEGFDADGDGVTSCAGDCNEADPGAWGFPFEVTGLRPNGTSQSEWIWDAQAPLVGPGVLYDFASGPMSPGGVILGSGSCLGSVSPAQFTDTQPTPALGWGTWFLVLAKNSCLMGSYGTDYLGSDRPVPPCP